MKKFLILATICFLSLQAYASEKIDTKKDTVIKSKLFSITMPDQLKNTYEIKKEKDKISIFHKDSKEAGFGGFAFGIKAYRNPADHAVLPGSRKLGELKDRKGNIYDIVLKHPTDVQYNYIKSPEPPKTFKQLYDLGNGVNIKGINGAIYYKNMGMKGEDLYKEILQKHITAVNEKWDSAKLEKENMSYMYHIIPKDTIGYAYYDINADGIEELVVGEIAEGNFKGVIYDIYTMVNREPKHVVSGGTRNRYYVCDDAFVCNEYSSGAEESGVRIYNLVENSTELFPQVSFKYDGYENSENPYFLAYSNEKWENVSKKIYDDRKKVFEKYERFNFVSLMKDKPIKKAIVDKYNPQKDYFDYSVLLEEFPKDYYYTTVKINKTKERILIVTDRVNNDNSSNSGLFYYIDKDGWVCPLGFVKSEEPLMQSGKYLYLKDNNYIKFYISDKKFEIIKSKVSKTDKKAKNIEFETIKSADRFKGEFGSSAGDDIKRLTKDGLYFEYHTSQYKQKYIEKLMQECLDEGVKTQVQMYCLMVKKLHQ